MANQAIRDALGRLQPGSSLASNSQRKRLRDLIAKHCGPDAEDVISFFAGVMKGTERVPMRSPGPGEDSVSYALVPLVAPSIKERMAAGEILAAYFFGSPGKATDPIDLPEGMLPGELRLAEVDYSNLETAELAEMERLAQKTMQQRGIITVEPTRK